MSFLQNFPSFTSIFQKIWDICKRFPFVMLSTLSATICSLILSESDKISSELLIQKLFLFSLLGIPLFIALKMFAERHHWKFLKSLRIQVIGFFLLLLYYILTPLNFDSLEKHIIQYALFFIFCLFLNAFIPYLKEKNTQGFWQYNKSMFIGFLTSILYSHVMGLGLIIALAAIDHLFNMEVDPKRYFQIWIVTSILFNTSVFIAKLPTDLDVLENDYSYPKGLKVFIQYILLPLVGLYLIILYAYEAKIIITWNWPIGWVSNLVLCYSVVSILSLLLLYPLKEQKENKWIQVFSKWFFRALIPLVAMLFLAIIERISQYGITEPRYFVFAMAIGLAVVVLYFVISKSKDIRIIPITIAVLAFVSALGPWSAFSVSLNSQKNRLESLLIQNDLFVEGKLVTADKPPDFESRKEMSSIVEYLVRTHGVLSLNRFIDDSTLTAYKSSREKEINTSGVGRDKYGSDANDLCSMLGFDFVSRWNTLESGKYFYLKTNKSSSLEVSGFEKLFYLHHQYSGSDTLRFELDFLQCFVDFDQDKASIHIQINDSLKTYDSLDIISLPDTLFNLSQIIDNENISYDDLSFYTEGQYYDAKIIFFEVSGYTKKNTSISSFDAVLLIKKK